jgi:type I restriction enzyme S subunit
LVLNAADEHIIARPHPAYTADSAIITDEYQGAVAGYDMVVTVVDAQAEFIAHTLLASYVLDDQLIIASMRSAQPHLNAEELGAARILVPPVSEQASIVKHLDRLTVNIDTAITRTNREMNLLTEYRSRLTADIVTGKLAVREAAAALPEVDALAQDDKPDTPESETDLDELEGVPEEAES